MASEDQYDLIVIGTGPRVPPWHTAWRQAASRKRILMLERGGYSARSRDNWDATADKDWQFPMGLIQMCATSHGEQIHGEAVPGWLNWLPEMPSEKMAGHSIDFRLHSEDLPRPENRITYEGDKAALDLDCKGHELDNLYVTDASFVPSIGAVNPTLTIIAKALCVADRNADRLGT